MASNEAGQVGQILGNVFRLLKILTLNTWRRLLMLGHYTINCFHQQRLRRAWRVLGRRVHQALESGEVNPMLAGEVKDSLTKAQAIQAAKDKHYRAIVALHRKLNRLPQWNLDRLLWENLNRLRRRNLKPRLPRNPNRRSPRVKLLQGGCGRGDVCR